MWTATSARRTSTPPSWAATSPCASLRRSTPTPPKLLLIRDSYSDSLAPFLTQNFSEIHLFDPRMNLNSIKTYVQENQIDQIVVLYSIPNFIESKDLFLLGR